MRRLIAATYSLDRLSRVVPQIMADLHDAGVIIYTADREPQPLGDTTTLATAVTMGAVALPEMKKLKYDPALSTGVVAAGDAYVAGPPAFVELTVAALQAHGVPAARIFASVL